MTPFDRGFRKIAELTELPYGEPLVFRTGGASILLLRSRFGVRAVDAGGFESLGTAAEETSELLDRAPLPVEVHAGAVWVCVDLCTRGE